MSNVQGLVDFHCHLDLYPDFDALVRECEKAGVFTLTVTTTPRAWPRNRELTEITKHVRAALGMHPQLVSEHAHELPLWKKYLPETRYVGEVGLDAGPRFYKSLEVQKRVFSEVLQACAAAGGKILTVHSVRATKAVLDHVEEHLPAHRGKVVLHWFTGTKAEVERAVTLGCYFSINAEMIENTKRTSVISAIPIERVLTETDGPFTTTDGRPSRPLDVYAAVKGLAKLHARRDEDLLQQVRSNLKALLSVEK